MRVLLKTAVVSILFASANCVWAQNSSDKAVLSQWTWPADIVLPLVITALIYCIGMLKMLRRSRRNVDLWSVVFFAAGWLSLLIALDSPIHELGEQLFWVHMTQHEILVLISAPLLVLGRPVVAFLWVLPKSWREPVARIFSARVLSKPWVWISAPLSAWLLHALALWLWHAPVLFDATLSSNVMHAAQHISFLGTALLFWWALIERHSGRFSYGAALLYVFTTAVHTSVLGALLTFAPRPWYSPYFATAPLWKLSALEDQQLGGLIMWIPAGTLLLAISLVLLVRWMQESGQRWEYTRAAALLRSAAEVSREA